MPLGDALALTRALVAVDSRNPALVEGAPGERAVAQRLAEVLVDWGLEVTVMDAGAGRPNVVARATNPATRSSNCRRTQPNSGNTTSELANTPQSLPPNSYENPSWCTSAKITG